ncbi:helix-turn-helix domain-containing protein [Streptomyces sp. PvR034]|uniref:TetR/AcrR family transcriptional regulator n=1 Tax=Streptomyces sp. PvR034 TaxID=3156401 RepID=UPI0033993F9F
MTDHHPAPAPGTGTPPVGRRERKKAATRQALADAALELFLAHGYDQVSVKDIAEAADVSTTTLFKHFPGKEALVFDMDAEREALLVSAVRDRAPGQSIPAALRACLSTMLDPHAIGPAGADFVQLIENTPVLSQYARRMWMRHESALARAIAEEAGAPEDDPLCAALARFALQSHDLVRGPGAPRTGIDSAFDLLEHGWTAANAHRRA